MIEKGYIFTKEEYYNNYIPKNVVGQKRCDWVIDDCYFIEFFGMMHLEHYRLNAEYKIEICKQYNLKLLTLYPQDFNKKELWKEKIVQFIK